MPCTLFEIKKRACCRSYAYEYVLRCHNLVQRFSVAFFPAHSGHLSLISLIYIYARLPLCLLVTRWTGWRIHLCAQHAARPTIQFHNWARWLVNDGNASVFLFFVVVLSGRPFLLRSFFFWVREAQRQILKFYDIIQAVLVKAGRTNAKWRMRNAYVLLCACFSARRAHVYPFCFLFALIFSFSLKFLHILVAGESGLLCRVGAELCSTPCGI